MMRLHSETEVRLCARCGKFWTGTVDGHCSFCVAEIDPPGVEWLRIVITLTAAVLVAAAVWL